MSNATKEPKTENTTVRLRPESYQKAQRIVGAAKFNNLDATLSQVTSDAVDALPEPSLSVPKSICRKSQSHRRGNRE
jgi:hypothetical protein